MKFFIDTANLEQIQEAYDLGVLDGVTTNPSLMAKEGIKGTENQREHYIKICKIVNADVSAEVIATDYEGMIREGRALPHSIRISLSRCLALPMVSKLSSTLQKKESGPIVHWYFPSDRHCWLQSRSDLRFAFCRTSG